MPSLYLLGVLLVTFGYINCAAILPYMKDPDSPEIWELDNLVEPYPNLVMFPHIYNHDRAKAKVPPHDRLKALIKAIMNYDTNHEAGDKRKFVGKNPLHNKSVTSKEVESSSEVVKDLLTKIETPVTNEEQLRTSITDKLNSKTQKSSSGNPEGTIKEDSSPESARHTPTELEEFGGATHEPEVLILNVKTIVEDENLSKKESKSSYEDKTEYLKKELQKEFETFKNVAKQEELLETGDKLTGNSDDNTENITAIEESSRESIIETDNTTQKPEVLLEEIVDSIVHIPSIWASDKSHRYTHSIRHGYGVPLQYSHIR